MTEKRALITGLGDLLVSTLRLFGEAGFLLCLPTGAWNDSPVAQFSGRICLISGALARVVRELRPTVVVHLAAIALSATATPKMLTRLTWSGRAIFLRRWPPIASGLECVLLPSSANIYRCCR